MTTKHQAFGLLAKFAGTKELLQAARQLREAGYRHFDCHSPFPVHGLDKAMGLGQSKLGWIVMVCGVMGLITGLGLQWWSAAVAYPLVISGKPLFSYQAFVPIIFEVTILFSAFGAVFGMLTLNKLPRWNHPLFNAAAFKKVTDDAFFVSVEASDPKFNETECEKLLESMGAVSVEKITC